MLKKALLLIILFSGLNLKAQSKMTPVKPITIEARVVGILSGNPKLAVIYITEVDSTNEYGYKKDTEILAQFYFGTAPHKYEPILTGTKPGDIISAEIAIKANRSNGNPENIIFKYSVISSAKENPSSVEGETPQK